MEYFLPNNYSSWSKIYYRICSKNSQYWNLENKEISSKKHLLVTIDKKNVYLIYSNIEHETSPDSNIDFCKLIIEETLVIIDKIQEDYIWLTGTTQTKYSFEINNNRFSYLDNLVLIKQNNEKDDLQLNFFLDKKQKQNLDKNSKTSYRIIEDDNGKYSINYILPEINILLDKDYLYLIQIIKLFYKVSFEKKIKIPMTKNITWYDYNFSLDKKNINNCVNYNMKYFKNFLDNYEENRVYKSVLINKLDRFNIFLNTKNINEILSENAIHTLKDICIDYYNNCGILVIEQNYTELIELQNYEEVNFMNDKKIVENDGWQVLSSSI